MEWQLALAVIMGGLVFLFLTGLPVAFCFMLLNVIAMFFMWGGTAGLHQLVFSMYSSVTTFALLPVIMFILMGEVIFQSGVFVRTMDVMEAWIGALPGRLSLVTIGGATLFACLSGSSMAGVALFGALMAPEMERRGYKKDMSLGPIMGGGGLAMIIPPSALAVFEACIAQISVGRLLISGVLPGLFIAILYAIYIIGRCKLQPSMAPYYVPAHIPLSEKVMSTVRYVLPFGTIVFIVIGLILLGMATPTESSAMGALATFILAAFYKKMNWKVVKNSVSCTLHVCIMLLLILTGSTAFSQVLATTGASKSLAEFAVTANVPPVMLLIVMQIILLILGCFMDGASILMITLPIFMPIVRATGLDPILFGLLTLVNLETGMITPPFGLSIFVAKGVAPPDTTTLDLWRAATPFVLCNLVAIATIIAIPQIALFLPNLMSR